MTTTPVRELVLHDVSAERDRQDAKWGASNIVNRTGLDALAVLMEEVGEVARAVLERDNDSYRKELVQVAAVAVAALEAFDGRDAEGWTKP